MMHANDEFESAATTTTTMEASAMMMLMMMAGSRPDESAIRDRVDRTNRDKDDEELEVEDDTYHGMIPQEGEIEEIEEEEMASRSEDDDGGDEVDSLSEEQQGDDGVPTASTTKENAMHPKKEKGGRRKRLLTKAPDAPKRFRSAFIHFSVNMHKQIRSQLGSKSLTERTANISKLVGDAWKKLTPEEREPWEAISREDRARFEREKSSYAGPWKIPKTRKTKDLDAPKKPMSAFFAFASARRSGLTANMVGASNGDISKALAVMWKEAPAEVRQSYIDDELKKRQQYLAAIKDFRKQKDKPKPTQQKRLERHQRQAKELVSAARAKNKDHNDHSRQQERGLEHQHVQNDGDHQRHIASAVIDHTNDNDSAKVHMGTIMVGSQLPRHYQPQLLPIPPETTHLKRDDSQDLSSKERQELLESFFYPEYLRDAIKRALIEYETVQAKRARQALALS